MLLINARREMAATTDPKTLEKKEKVLVLVIIRGWKMCVVSRKHCNLKGPSESGDCHHHRLSFYMRAEDCCAEHAANSRLEHRVIMTASNRYAVQPNRNDRNLIIVAVSLLLFGVGLAT